MDGPESDPVATGWLEEFDGPAEVEAAARTQRRIAIGYGLVFLVGVLTVPLLNLTLPWWSESRLLGGMSPSFVTVAGGLYLFFLVLGISVVTLTRSVEDRMLGSSDHEDPAP